MVLRLMLVLCNCLVMLAGNIFADDLPQLPPDRTGLSTNELFGRIYYPESINLNQANDQGDSGYWKVSTTEEFVQKYVEFSSLREELIDVIRGGVDWNDKEISGILADKELAKDRHFYSKFNIAIVAAGHLRLSECIEPLLDHVMYSVTLEGVPVNGMFAFMHFSAAYSLSKIGGAKTIRQILLRLSTNKTLSREEVYVLTWILQEIVGYEFVEGMLTTWEGHGYGASSGTQLAKQFVKTRDLRLWTLQEQSLPGHIEMFLKNKE